MPDTPNSNSASNILDILLEEKHITPDQADQARRRMTRGNLPASQALMELGFATQEQIGRALSKISGIPFVILAEQELTEAATQKVTPKVALKYQFVPISLERGTLKAAFAVPPTLRDRETLRLLLALRLDPVLATPNEIDINLKKIYGLGAGKVLQLNQDRKAQKSLEVEGTFDDKEEQNIDGSQEQDASIIQLVNEIISDAIRQHATDIHIEPFRDKIRLRYRIDGMLRDIPTPPGMVNLRESIVSRLKIMARLNIAEKRLPHDGRIRLLLNNEPSDLRVSIMPTRFGETICLRVLASSSVFMGMEQLGFSKYQMAITTRLASLPHGIVLVTGPTGSGKTTTLYAALAYVRGKSPERKIITIENPVEIELQGTTQIQVHPEIGLTFASALRSILRHDPDIILVGEIRDNETADIAIQSALTGHLVLSTLHTNDSVGAVNRLINMGVEPYLLAASLVAVIAQRLVRRICVHCKVEDDTATRRIRSEMASTLGMNPEDIQTWRGKGCLECNHTGYKGRVALYEFFLLDEELQDMVAAHAGSAELRHTAIERGMKTLRQDGWLKASQGNTTIEEVKRVTSTMQISYDIDEEDM